MNKTTQHFEVLTAVLLDIDVLRDLVMCRSVSSARHFEGLQCLHLQVLYMDLSSTLKVSYILNCLTLGDEGDKILQNTGNYSPNDADDLNPQHKICMTENSQHKSRPYKLCKELFSRYVPCTFLSTFKLQQNSCCLDRSKNISHYTAFTCNI